MEVALSIANMRGMSGLEFEPRKRYQAPRRGGSQFSRTNIHAFCYGALTPRFSQVVSVVVVVRWEFGGFS